MVASSQPFMGILRCDSRLVISLDLAARACCPCCTYAGDTRPLAKVRLAAFMLHVNSYVAHPCKGAGYIKKQSGDYRTQSCKVRHACLQSDNWA